LQLGSSLGSRVGGNKSDALKLRLQQPNHEKDEYYFRSADDGRYVAVSRPRSVTRELIGLELTDDVSQATLFGLTQCDLPHLPRLETDQRVVYRIRVQKHSSDPYYDSYCDWAWVRGRVVNKRHTDFGGDVRISYDGNVLNDDGVPETRSGTTDWLPLTSRRIDLEKPYDHRVLNIDLHEESLSEEESECPYISSNLLSCSHTECNLCNRHDAVEPCDLIIREAEDRVYRKLKSRPRCKKKKGKSKGKKKRSNAAALRSLKRTRRKTKKKIKSTTS